MIRILLFLLLGATYALTPSPPLVTAETFSSVFPIFPLEGGFAGEALWMEDTYVSDASETAAQFDSSRSRTLLSTGFYRHLSGGKGNGNLQTVHAPLRRMVNHNIYPYTLHPRDNVPHYLFLQNLRL